MIIFRYLLKEVYGTLLACTAVLLLILVSNQFIHYLTQAASGVIPLRTVMQMMSLQIPLLLPILLPLGLYLGILIGYGRLYADREMTVLSACGFSKAQLIRMTLIFAALVGVVIGVLTLWVQPLVENYKRDVIIEAASTSPMERIFAGKFQPLADSGIVFYAQDLSRDHKQLENIFVVQPDKTNPGHWIIVKAVEGSQRLDPKTGDKFLVLNKGFRYQGNPGQTDFQVTKFDQYGVRIQEQVIPAKDRIEAMPTLELWNKRHENRKFLAELQWRIALPLSVFILAFMALGLSSVKPRQGRYAQLLPAALIYIGYADLSFLGKAWLEKGQVPEYLGLWWIQALLFLASLLLLFRFIGFRRVVWFLTLGFNRRNEDTTSVYCKRSD